MQPMRVMAGLCTVPFLSSVDNYFVLISYAISGLVNALKLLQPIKDKYSGVTYADLFQLASATAIEVLSTCFY